MVEADPQKEGTTYLNAGRSHANDHGAESCGYCDGSKGKKGHKSWGITTPKLTVNDYQKLMDRGWRRCGDYSYKWDLEQSCCQPFTIRLDANEF